MANLAIRGHKTRGNEVIEILEMLGGNNRENCWGIFDNRLYLINSFSDIEDKSLIWNESNYHLYTLEEFLEKFPYKVGDLVLAGNMPCRVLSMQWSYTQNEVHYMIENYQGIHTAEYLQPYKEKEQKTIEGFRMANLGIKGHATRGKEVIEILEMLGAQITSTLHCSHSDWFYFVDKNGFVQCKLNKNNDGFKVYTLEEFLENYPYKVGDRVKKANDDDGYCATVISMDWDSDTNKIIYTIIFDDHIGSTLECLSIDLQLYKEQETVEENSILNQLSELDSKTFADGYDQGYDDGQHDMTEWNLPDGFIFKDENGNVINANKIVLEKKKPKYPKTYEECCRVLGISDGEFMFNGLSDDEYDLFDSFVIIKRCRDAYWKIAGEEMGLGKPWKPDFSTIERGGVVYGLHNLKNEIVKIDSVTPVNLIIAFPKAKIRNIFYENFKDLIEECKEFL